MSSSWVRVLAAKSMRKKQERNKKSKRTNGKHGLSNQPQRILLKRRALLEGSRRPMNELERKIKTLKKLVPNGKSMGLDGLFRETADYILSLEMQMKVMQIIVHALSGSNE